MQTTTLEGLPGGVNLDLDDEFMYHLVEPDSWSAIQAADPDILEDERVREMLTWQREHFDRHGVLASATHFSDEFKVELYEPAIQIDELIDKLSARSLNNQFRTELRSTAEDFKRGEDSRMMIASHLARMQPIQDSLFRHGHHVFTMSEIEDKPQEFLVEPYIPLKTFTLLQGPGGVGKSIFVVWQISQLPEESVLLVGEEDPVGVSRRRLDESGADLDRVHWWNLDESPLTFPSCERKLETQIKTLGISFTVFDTITEFLDPKLKTNEADDVTQVIRSLRRVATRTNSAILGIGHSNRIDSGDSYKRIGGSVAWHNRAKSVLMLGEDPVEDDIIHLFHEKSNFSEKGVPLQFRRVGRGGTVYLEPCGQSDLEFHEVFNAKVHKPTKTEAIEPFFLEWESKLPANLTILREDFRERHPDISDVTFDRGRKTRNWVTYKIDGTHYVGTTASFKGWTPPSSSKPSPRLS
jgi:hypothetical protein